MSETIQMPDYPGEAAAAARLEMVQTTVKHMREIEDVIQEVVKDHPALEMTLRELQTAYNASEIT
jgi:hypothetical protein